MPAKPYSLRSASRNTTRWSSTVEVRPLSSDRSPVTTARSPTAPPSASSLVAACTSRPESTSSNVAVKPSHRSRNSSRYGSRSSAGAVARCSAMSATPSAAQLDLSAGHLPRQQPQQAVHPVRLVARHHRAAVRQRGQRQQGVVAEVERIQVNVARRHRRRELRGQRSQRARSAGALRPDDRGVPALLEVEGQGRPLSAAPAGPSGRMRARGTAPGRAAGGRRDRRQVVDGQHVRQLRQPRARAGLDPLGRGAPTRSRRPAEPGRSRPRPPRPYSPWIAAPTRPRTTAAAALSPRPTSPRPARDHRPGRSGTRSASCGRCAHTPGRGSSARSWRRPVSRSRRSCRCRR